MSETVVTPAFAAHLDRTPGMYAAVADESRHPETTRVLFALAEPGTEIVRFLVSAASAERFLAKATVGRRACLVACALATYETLQYKGDVVEVRPSGEDELEGLRRSIDAFCGLVARVGIDSARYRAHLEVAPFVTIRLKVDSVFDQTPRVGAGSLVSGSRGL